MPWRRMKEWKYISSILNLGVRWKWVVSFTTLPLYPRANRYPCGWVGSRDNLEVMEERKIVSPYRELNPSSSVFKPVAWLLYRLSYSGLSLRTCSSPKKKLILWGDNDFRQKCLPVPSYPIYEQRQRWCIHGGDDTGYVLLGFGIMYSGRRVLVLNITLKMEAVSSSETSIISCCTTL
jgi:hypothetical protein